MKICYAWCGQMPGPETIKKGRAIMTLPRFFARNENLVNYFLNLLQPTRPIRPELRSKTAGGRGTME